MKNNKITQSYFITDKPFELWYNNRKIYHKEVHKMKKIILGLITGVILSTGIFIFAAANQWIAVSPNFEVYVRGEIFQPEDPTVVIDGRTYLPLRAMSEALDVDIFWDGDARQVLVDMGKSDGEEEDKSEDKSEDKEVVHKDDVYVKSDVVDAKPGATIEIPLKLTDVPSVGINSGFIKVVFDNKKIEVLDIVGGEIVNAPEKDIQYYINNEEGMFTLMYIEAEQQRKGMIMEDGTFITIKAKAKTDALTGANSDSVNVKLTVEEVNFEDYDLNRMPISPSLGDIIIKK